MVVINFQSLSLRESNLLMTFEQLLAVALKNSNPSVSFTMETISRLDRLGAFNGKPALRFIAVTAVKSGTAERLSASAGWDETACREVRRFIAHTGFNQRLATGFFDAYATCLGWNSTDTTPCCKSKAETISSMTAHEEACPYGNNPLAHSANATNQSIVSATVTIDRRAEAVCGLTINTVDLKDSGKSLKARIVIERILPMGSGVLYYTVYDISRIPIISGIAATITVATPSPFIAKIEIPIDFQCAGSITFAIK